MSFCAQAMVAATKAVATPTTAMIVPASGAWASTGAVRAIRYTPAVTIVAAWMSADTGVGPSIASGNQMYRGSCADFPAAPKNSSRATPVAVTSGSSACARAVKSSDPIVTKTNDMASMKPTSPTRLVTNAFLPAAAAVGRSNQKLISRYEQAPTPSHPRKATSIELPSTSISIEKAKRFKYTKNFGYFSSPCM